MTNAPLRAFRATSGSRRRTSPGPKRAASRRRRSSRRSQQWWPAVLLVTAVIGGIAVDSGSAPAAVVAAPHCTVPGSNLRLRPDQAANAATIADVARARGLPPRAVVIALATAQQESGLRNLPYGDRDSLGLFQQRPSQGWGTPAEVQDPVHAAGRFYDHLVRIPHWQTGELTVVAQAVQRSAYPRAYQRWEPMATALAAALHGAHPGRLACT
jgi:hypothetical protein